MDKKSNLEEIKKAITLQVKNDCEIRKLQAEGTFAFGIAQDFNEILMAIMGYVEMAMLDLPQKNPARTSLDQALLAIERAKDLVTDLFDYSSLKDEGREPTDIGQVAKNDLDKLRKSLPDKIKLKVRSGPDLGHVNISKTQFRTILMNLCTNAVQAMLEKGGMLDVSLESVELNSKTTLGLKAGRYAKLCVTDSGCGIEPEIMNRIFDPYYSTQDKGSVSGMGLAVVNSIVHFCGGAIFVESVPGKGSEFSIHLPLL